LDEVWVSDGLPRPSISELGTAAGGPKAKGTWVHRTLTDKDVMYAKGSGKIIEPEAESVQHRVHRVLGANHDPPSFSWSSAFSKVV